MNALRALEAAGRHLSLSRAAEELHVTPAAVSHQIKGMEDHLGVTLFKRMNRALPLTDEGQACVPGLRSGFQQLAEGMEAARSQIPGRAPTVSVAPFFGAKWLVPRPDQSCARYRGADVRVDAGTRLADPLREDIDLRIRYGQGDYPGLRVGCLMSDEVIPVCGPELLKGPKGLNSPAELCHQSLLHADPPYENGYPDWRV